MIRSRLGYLLTVALLVVATSSAISVNTFMDTGGIGAWGAMIKPGSTAQAAVQPFVPWVTGYANRIGVGIAQAQDPNGVGFKVTLTEISSLNSFYTNQLPGTPMNDSWTIKPVQGAALAWSYIDIDPIYLDANKTYGLIIEPGDAQMYGSVALCLNRVPAWKSADNWASNSLLNPMGYTACIRVYGTEAPEPSSLLALLCGVGGVGGMMWRRKKRK